ncbi:MAG TPA: N-acetyltransferase [Cytophagales bacterium]|nr:N-acetyltransferase [Cytophagales bacterium]HAA20903.1 N-acetyltransferase [Cytophagales bacterium]HAP65197.1 N-acetyltransferase [Cytophagales bacterium]
MLQIRKATEEDLDVLHELMLGIAQYHNQEEYLLTTLEQMRQAGFGEQAQFGAFLAEWDGQPAGYLSYTWNYSIWRGDTFMNIDDVFVWEQYRGKKIGDALMQQAKDLCQERKVSTIRWEVEKDNAGAIKFYERLGAEVTVKGVCKWHLGEGAW